MSKNISYSIAWIIHENSDLNWVHHKPSNGSHIICSLSLCELQICTSWMWLLTSRTLTWLFHLGRWPFPILLENTRVQQNFRDERGVEWPSALQNHIGGSTFLFVCLFLVRTNTPYPVSIVHVFYWFIICMHWDISFPFLSCSSTFSLTLRSHVRCNNQSSTSCNLRLTAEFKFKIYLWKTMLELLLVPDPIPVMTFLIKAG